MKTSTTASTFFPYLLELRDDNYQNFISQIVPNISSDTILGVRIPLLRKFAKQMAKEHPDKVTAFLQDLPHTYFDENNLHGLFVSEQTDMNTTIALLDDFLPHVNNWATCDLIRPKVFAKHTSELLSHVKRWMYSDHAYTIRFGIEMLMVHYLDTHFQPEYLTSVVSVQKMTEAHQTYYVKMMIAWFFATALAKQPTATLPIIEQGCFDAWTHRMTIQKARESQRISPKMKRYLQSLKTLS